MQPQIKKVFIREFTHQTILANLSVKIKFFYLRHLITMNGKGDDNVRIRSFTPRAAVGIAQDVYDPANDAIKQTASVNDFSRYVLHYTPCMTQVAISIDIISRPPMELSLIARSAFIEDVTTENKKKF